MRGVNQLNTFTKKMATKDFLRLSRFIEHEIGIKMPIAKKTMLESRLQRRLRILNLNTFSDYCKYLFNSDGMNQELINLIDVVTTNKTDFFREPTHFVYLQNKVLPEFLQINRNKFCNIWSAGCSFGDEPYTLAIIFSEISEKHTHFHFSILATDISLEALKTAKEGIYKFEKVEHVPIQLRKKYLLRNKDRNKKLVRIVPELRKKVNFQRLNLMEDFKMIEKMDIIFCRNVIIYFHRNIQEDLIRKFHKQLNSDGYLFLGHSETLNGLDIPFVQVAPTIYKKLNDH